MLRTKLKSLCSSSLLFGSTEKQQTLLTLPCNEVGRELGFDPGFGLIGALGVGLAVGLGSAWVTRFPKVDALAEGMAMGRGRFCYKSRKGRQLY